MRTLCRVLLALVATLSLPVLIGCSSESCIAPTPEAPARSKDVYLTLKVSVAETYGRQTGTRAGNDYYFEEPQRSNETIHTLRVFIVREDGIVEAARRENVDNADTGIGSGLTFKVTPGRKTIYLIANEESLPQSLRDIIGSISVNSSYPASVLVERYIGRNQNSVFYTVSQNLPMTESFNINLTEPEGSGPAYFTADLFVTRLPVKYTFICAEDVSALWVRLNNMAQDQYFMPRAVTYFPSKYEPAQNINGVLGRNITTFNAPPSLRRSDFIMKLSGKSEVWLENSDGSRTRAYRYDPVYLMETPTPSGGFTMSIRFDDGKETGEWFPDSKFDNLPLLPRNTHVVVNMSVKEYGVDCKVDVVPYRGCVLEPYFGLQRD